MSAPASNPAERFAAIIATLVAMVAARLVRPFGSGPAGHPALALAIATRLQRLRNRLASLHARWRAGTLRPPRQRPPRQRPPRQRPAAPPRRPAAATGTPPTLPRSRLWLVRLVPGSGVGANYLKILLDDPEMQALIEAAPQAGRILRPFWHMLSRDPLPPLLQPPRPQQPRPAPPPQAAPPPAAAATPPSGRPARPHRPPPSPPAPEVAARAPLPAGLGIA